MEKWANKVAVITGGCSGIGAEILTKLHQNGVKIVNLDVNVNENNENDSKIFNRRCDVADLDSIKENFAWIEKTFGEINILINCAGVCYMQPLMDPSDENTERINKSIDINFRGYIHCAREAIKLMQKSDDCSLIVNVSSLCAHKLPYFVNSIGSYGCTKHGVKAMAEVIRQELVTAKIGKIRISCVSPSTVNTNLLRDYGVTRELMESLNYLESSDIADAVLYLLSTPCTVNVTDIIIRSVGEEF